MATSVHISPGSLDVDHEGGLKTSRRQCSYVKYATVAYTLTAALPTISGRPDHAVLDSGGVRRRVVETVARDTGKLRHGLIRHGIPLFAPNAMLSSGRLSIC